MALKNHANGARNPFAQRQKVRTMDEIMEGPISGTLTRLQCCPVGEGAAAVVLVSADALDRLGLDRARCPRILSSVTRSQGFYRPGADIDATLTAETAGRALADAGVAASDDST